MIRSCFALFTFAALTTVTTAVFAQTEIRNFETKGLKSFKLANMAGKVSVTATNDATVLVAATKVRFSADRCRLTVERDGSQISARVEQLATDLCEVAFEVRLPAATDLDLDVGAGNVNITGMQGKLAFNVGSGDLKADGRFRSFDGQAGSGDVRIDGLLGNGSLTAGQGDVNLSYAEAPTAGDLELIVGNGDTIVSFPPEARLRAEFTAGRGRLTNAFTADPKAPFVLEAKTGSGNLDIRIR